MNLEFSIQTITNNKDIPLCLKPYPQLLHFNSNPMFIDCQDGNSETQLHYSGTKQFLLM